MCSRKNNYEPVKKKLEIKWLKKQNAFLRAFQRDVTESTKEFIDKEQVTSMVARDVVDDTRFDTAPRSPADSTRKPSPERPGYPRGIPGLREDDRQKPIPAAGKPSRPPQRERSPQRPVEHGR